MEKSKPNVRVMTAWNWVIVKHKRGTRIAAVIAVDSSFGMIHIVDFNKAREEFEMCARWVEKGSAEYLDIEDDRITAPFKVWREMGRR